MATRRSAAGLWLLTASLLMAFLAVGCPAGDGAARTDEGKWEQIQRLCAKYKESYPETPELTVEEFLEKKSGNGAVLVDAREPYERRVSMIPGAISRDTFEERKAALKGREIVVHCTIGYRSGLYAKDLREEGFDAFNLRGSALAWAHAGGEFVGENGKPTRRVHVYDAKWNLLPEGYEGVW